jgi:LDH2 family malate/lactate/ureidoglycolate dehydrogenase
MMAEILCAALSGGAMSLEVGGIRIKDRPMRVSQFFQAIDVSRFMPVEELSERVGRLVAMMKSAEPASGYNEVLVAGDPEWRSEETRRQTGIPLSEGVWKTLTDTAALLGVVSPPVSTIGEHG